MNKITLQNLFENFLISKKIPYSKDFPHAFGKIDFKIEIDGKVCGVEIKSTKGKIATTIGQLLLARKTFSHVYLLAPIEFLRIVKEIMEWDESLSKIGLITLEKGEFIFVKEPNPDNYYFKPVETPKINVEKKPKHIVIVDRDYFLLLNFQDKIFDSSMVSKRLKVSRTEAYNRIRRLLKVGLIEEVSSYNPKQFRVKKFVELRTKLPLYLLKTELKC